MPIFIIKSRTLSIFSLARTRIKQDASKNGPNGITFSFLKRITIKANGIAKTLDKNIDTKLIHGPTQQPIKNISFISPPPRDSFLNKKFPKSINDYIQINAMKPYNKK